MGGSDCDRKGIAAGSGNEFLNFFGTCVAGLACLDNNFILYAFESSELCLYNNTVCMRIFNYLLGQSNVVFERLGRSEEASIMTEVNPPSMQFLHSSKESP